MNSKVCYYGKDVNPSPDEIKNSGEFFFKIVDTVPSDSNRYFIFEYDEELKEGIYNLCCRFFENWEIEYGYEYLSNDILTGKITEV